MKIYTKIIAIISGILLVSCSNPTFRSLGASNEKPAGDKKVHDSDNVEVDQSLPPQSSPDFPTDNTTPKQTNEDSDPSSNLSCVFNGEVIKNGKSTVFYDTQTSNSCLSHKITRTCNDGVLSGEGSYRYLTCSVPKKFDQENCSKNYGRWIQGSCWFVGKQGETCSKVCGSEAKVNIQATKYVGSAGNSDPNPNDPMAPGDYTVGATALCVDVLNFTLTQNQSTMNNCGNEGQGIGCARLLHVLGGQFAARCMAVTTTANASASNANRACACID